MVFSCSFQANTLIPLCPSGPTSGHVIKPISGHSPSLRFLPLISLDDLVADFRRTSFSWNIIHLGKRRG